jgi:hypothetical protein
MPQSQEKGQNPIVSDLTSLQVEYSQLSELEEMQHNYVVKLVETLKALQGGVGTLLLLRPETLGERRFGTKKVYLAANAVVLMEKEDGKSESASLSEFEPEEVLAIVEDSTPQLLKIVSERRKAVGARVDLLEKMLKELKKAGDIMKEARQSMPSSVEGDLVQDSIMSP